MNKLIEYSDVLTVDELKDILQIGRNNAYRLVNSGAIRVLKIGKQIRIPKTSLEKYINGDYDINISGIAIEEGGNKIEG